MSIVEILEKYYDEMMAEGAWSGHEYAPRYLANIRNDLISYFNTIKQEYSSESSLWNYATHGLFLLSEDYDTLIDEVYAVGFSSHDKYAIADALNDDFKNKLAGAVEDAYGIARDILTGEELEKLNYLFA